MNDGFAQYDRDHPDHRVNPYDYEREDDYPPDDHEEEKDELEASQ